MGREWERVQPGQSRVPEGVVTAFLDRLEADGLVMHGFAMSDRGKLLAEGYWAPFTRESLHRMYSVGKSFVSLAIGLLQEEGRLHLDDRICEYFRDKCPKEGVHPWIGQMTIRNMLTMATCHRQTTYKRYKGDWVESFFRVQPDHLPGAVFCYDTSSTHVLAALAERLSGRKLMDYLRERAFDRIGVSGEAYFMEDPYGVSQGGSGLNCTLRDLLAVAQLVADGGRYRGEQLLPADYLKEALRCQIVTVQQPAYDEQLGYGYQIWQGRHGSFYFYGIGGQLAVCFPKERFVLVTMGDTLDNKNGIKDIFDAFESCIYPWIGGNREDETRESGAGVSAGGLEPGADGAAVTRESGADGAAVTRGSGAGGAAVRCEPGAGQACGRLTGLEDRLRALALAPVPGKSFSGIQDRINGREYAFGENQLQVSRLRVSFSGEGGCLQMTKEGRELALAFGYGGYVRSAFPWELGNPPAQAECLCHGAWVMEDYLYVRCHILGENMAKLAFGIRFRDGKVTLKLQKGADDALKSFEGVASSM